MRSEIERSELEYLTKLHQTEVKIGDLEEFQKNLKEANPKEVENIAILEISFPTNNE
jgi:hypothetical protein